MLEIGRKGCLEKTVTEDLSAKVWGSGAVDVYGTPCMIALVEETAWRSVQDELEPGQATVGTKLDIAHIAATPIGMKVRCETELIEIDRRRLVFSVNAYDEAGKIAEGTHERFIVDVEKFQAKAYAKAAR
jgi:predicted thioesterase